MWTELKSILNERIVNWTQSWEKGTTLALLVNFFKSTNCVAKGKLLSQMPMMFFFAKARRVIIQLSPNFFWNFSYPICMFLTLRQGFLTIFWIFKTGLMFNVVMVTKICTYVSGSPEFHINNFLKCHVGFGCNLHGNWVLK